MDVTLLTQVCNNDGPHYNIGYVDLPVIDVVQGSAKESASAD